MPGQYKDEVRSFLDAVRRTRRCNSQRYIGAGVPVSQCSRGVRRKTVVPNMISFRGDRGGAAVFLLWEDGAS